MMHMLDIYIVVLPPAARCGVRPNPLDFFSLVAIGCTLAAVFLKRLGDSSLFPVRDPRLGEVHRSEKLMKAAAQSKPLWLVLAGGFVLLLLFVIAVRLLTGLAPAPDEDAARAAERAKAYQELQAENAQKLENYAWVDKAKGTVQIPIERAMELAIAELNSKRPTPAGPIATPAPSPAASPAASPSPAAASPEALSFAGGRTGDAICGQSMRR